MDLSGDQRSVLLDVARQTIRSALGEAKVSAADVPIPDDPALHQPAGCFVTLHMLANHRLRGCVGRLDSREPLLTAVREAAKNVLQDPRFVKLPVRLPELVDLELEITVILPLQHAAGEEDFDLLNDGIYLTVGDRSGCFLPQVARETGWSREELLARLCIEKLGLRRDAWKGDAAKLMKFQTIVIGPERFAVQSRPVSMPASGPETRKSEASANTIG